MKRLMILTLLALLAALATACTNAVATPALGENGKPTFVFVYTDN